MKRIILLLITIISFQVQAKKYLQVGDEYSKISYKNLYHIQENPYIDKQIENTVLITIDRINSHKGTGFYIGEHNGKQVFITNSHVLSATQCGYAKITFLTKNLGTKEVECESILLSITPDFEETNELLHKGSDITVFTIKKSDLNNFIGNGLEIEWSEPIVSKTSLSQAGFGSKNANRQNSKNDFKMKLSTDSDCVISSKDNQLYMISSFGINNTFLTGCDMAQGDSGSSVISKNSGKVVGLIWGMGDGKENNSSGFWNSFSRNQYIVSSIYWNELIGSSDQRLFQSSSFAISLKSLRTEFAKIGVATYSQSPQIDAENN